MALTYVEGKLKNIVQEDNFLDQSRKTIGVAACDIDKDGFEEIYFLNTDTYSGIKKYSDRLLDKKNNNYLKNNKFLYFEQAKKDVKNYNDFFDSTHTVIKNLSIGDVSYTILINKNL